MVSVHSKEENEVIYIKLKKLFNYVQVRWGNALESNWAVALTFDSDPHPERHIPPGVDHNQINSGLRAFVSALATCEDLLLVMGLLGLTKYQLGRLLECRYDFYLYR